MLYLFTIISFFGEARNVGLNWFVNVQFAILPKLSYDCHGHTLADASNSHDCVLMTGGSRLNICKTEAYARKNN